MKTVVLVFFILLFRNLAFAQDTNTILSKANEYYLQSQFDVAEMQYRKALEKNPANIIAQYNLGNALQKQKKYDDAIELLNNLANTATNQSFKSSVYYNQGVAYTKEKNLEESIEAYKRSLRLSPNDQEARENLQKALLELKKKAEEKKKQDKQNQQQPKMSQKEAEQKLKLLQQKEKDLQQRLQNQNRQNSRQQSQDW
ncbi:MAG TPA: tetratricopeptide repeat protein [Flavisolibacter sp.]|nr:tetratricopeptide repeat protein [Flavisolibacter sp.]